MSRIIETRENARKTGHVQRDAERDTSKQHAKTPIKPASNRANPGLKVSTTNAPTRENANEIKRYRVFSQPAAKLWIDAALGPNAPGRYAT
jgi:hypothetical protein